MDSLGVLQRLGSGHMMDELHAALLKVADEVLATGKAGKVTLVLKVTKPKGEAPTIVIEDELAVGLPKVNTGGVFFFLHESQFHANDPRQTRFELRSVPGKEPEFRPETPSSAEERRAE